MKIRTLLAVIALALIGARAAQAQLLFHFNPAGLTGAPGETVTFNATLTNAGTDTLFLNGDGLSISGADFTLDDTPFVLDFPASLAPGESVTGDILNVQIGLSVLPGDYFGTFTILGGLDDTAQDELASQNFLVTVLAPVPEPGALCLLGAGALGALPLLRRRQR